MHNIMMYILHISFFVKLIKLLGGFLLFFPIKKFTTNQPFHVEVNKRVTLLHPSSNILIAKG